MPRRWIPNILTVTNLGAGLVAILLSLVEQWALAVALVSARPCSTASTAGWRGG
jgi:phosphatidylserine synthase